MPGIMDLMSQLKEGGALEKLGSQLGVDPATLDKGLAAAMPVLVSALAGKASTAEGAQALHQAVTRDHDGTILDDPSRAVEKADSGEGDRILGHALGDRQQVAQQAIAKTTGLDPDTAGRLMATVAPIVMGALGRLQQQHGLDADGLRERLDQEVAKAHEAAPGLMKVATQILDRNQDGSFLDDVGGFVGKLFEKR